MRNRLAAVLATVGLLASLGATAGLATAGPIAPAAHAAKKHKKKKHAAVKKRGCIPQTNVGTDHDPDNHGGPNDGDGCF